jgi:hypothetical protein
MTNPFRSPQSDENANRTSFQIRLLEIAHRRRGLLFGGVAIGLTLTSVLLMVVGGITLGITERRDGYPGDDRSFALECFVGVTFCLSVGASVGAACAAIYGAYKELCHRDNMLTAGTALLGLSVSVPWCAWLVYNVVFAFSNI